MPSAIPRRAPRQAEHLSAALAAGMRDASHNSMEFIDLVCFAAVMANEWRLALKTKH
jgi:hypothetical protein